MSLSDKAVMDFGCINPIPNYYWEDDVKEFIKEDMDLINDYVEGKVLNLGGLIKKRNELIGEGLI